MSPQLVFPLFLIRHSNDWYEYEDELIIVIETDDDRRSADHVGKKGKSGKKSSSKGRKSEKQRKGKSRKGRDDDHHHPAKKKSSKKMKKSNKYDGWYYLDDHWYIIDEDDDKVPSGPSKGRPSTPSNPSKGRPSAPSNPSEGRPSAPSNPSKGRPSAPSNKGDDDNDDKYHHPPSKYTKEPTQGKNNHPSKKSKSPRDKNKKSPTKETKSPTDNKKQNPTKTTKSPVNISKQPPTTVGKQPTPKKSPTQETKSPTDNKKQNPTKKTKSPVNNSKQPPTTVGKQPTPAQKHPPSKRTSSPSSAKKDNKTQTKSPSKTDSGITVPTTDKKKGPITKSPSISGKKVTKAPKAPNGGAKAKCPKGNVVDGTKVIIDYEYEVVIDDKKIQDERGAKDVLRRIEDELIQILSRDLLACSNVRALSSQGDERNLEEKRRLVELLGLQPTRSTAILNQHTCVQGWTGDSCSVKAIGEVEATVDGRSVDSIICSILDSISNFFENDVDVKGVKDVRFISTSNDSCKEGNFNKSNMIEKQWGMNDGVAWWIIMIILISVILLLYTFCMVLRRRRYSNYGLEKYEEVHNGEIAMENRIPHSLLDSRSSDFGERSFPTIDVKQCSSALCNSCGSEGSDDMNWVKTDMTDSRV